MGKLIAKAKASVKGIHWPNFKEIFGDTTFAVVTTVVLSLLVFLWTTSIELVINWIMSLF